MPGLQIQHDGIGEEYKTIIRYAGGIQVQTEGGRREPGTLARIVSATGEVIFGDCEFLGLKEDLLQPDGREQDDGN